MNSFISFLSILLLLHASSADLDVWPLPQRVVAGTSDFSLVPGSFTFKCVGASCSLNLISAFERYLGYIFLAGPPINTPTYPLLTAVLVNATSLPPLAIGVDESYDIDISPAGSAYIVARTEWGAIWALETLSQLVNYTGQGQYVIVDAPTKIADFPRFPWRGLLVDTARHFLPMRNIFSTLDAMSYNKMNVMHWHIVDDESFPAQSFVYPRLSADGAWSAKAVYSQQNISAVIAYANARGIHVVPEFDTPGHTTCWGRGYPALFANCPGERQVFNPTLNSTFEFMLDLLTEMGTLFPSPFFHLGGDEVNFGCWEADPTIAQFMKANNVPSYEALQGFYEEHVQRFANSVGKDAIFWEEVYNNGGFTLNSTSVVNVWVGFNDKVADVVRAGNRAVYSTPWYLDRSVPAQPQTWWFTDSWKSMYQQDPIGNQTLTPEQTLLVLGGEASMWSPQVDPTSWDAFTWPRTAAVAERLWSAADVQDLVSAQARLSDQRCRMVRRGIGATPIQPDYCVAFD